MSSKVSHLSVEEEYIKAELEYGNPDSPPAIKSLSKSTTTMQWCLLASGRSSKKAKL
jgi:hypothetical protein